MGRLVGLVVSVLLGVVLLFTQLSVIDADAQVPLPKPLPQVSCKLKVATPKPVRRLGRPRVKMGFRVNCELPPRIVVSKMLFTMCLASADGRGVAVIRPPSCQQKETWTPGWWGNPSYFKNVNVGCDGTDRAHAVVVTILYVKSRYGKAVVADPAGSSEFTEFAC